MTDNLQQVPEEFIENVKLALENLYDFPSLQRNPLLQQVNKLPKQNENPVQHLRFLLTEAIESLKPENQSSIRSGAARIYHLLHLHYLGGMVLPEVAQELGLSLRQVYRDLRRGQENIASILWYQFQKLPEESGIDLEVSRLELGFNSVNLRDLLDLAQKAVHKLAERLEIDLKFIIPEGDFIISSNSAIAQQVLINLISQTMQQMKPQRLEVHLQEDWQLRLLAYHSEANRKLKLDTVIEQLMKQLTWTRQEENSAKAYAQSLRLRREGMKVLIIDDNEGLTDLLTRYLASPKYRCFVAHQGLEGLKLAQEILPDVILMDLMMPGMDGWELLQRFRTLPETQTTPVIICSVINDPELAYSLGASAFVEKPIDKDNLLNILQTIVV